ncbi:transposase [Alloprevotella sp. OH1205_COT-284]|uniref:transposase n=1 Tax=Alloprevotella sp. OH1205_COT-284 TaxID=2491043 RepID=UPI0035110386
MDNFIRGFCRGFKVDDSGFKSFNVIAATLYEHYDEVLNFFVNRVTNAFTEFFNAIF